MSQKIRNVLVTGGAGFIGSHTCKQLANEGYQPIVFDNLSRGFKKNVRWGPFIQGDVRDEAAVTAAVMKSDPIAVIHFAGYAYVEESTQIPLEYHDVNVTGTGRVIKAIAAAVRERSIPLIFSSSCATYGRSLKMITENSPQRPINPYGTSKLIAERLILQSARINGTKFAILRYFNAAGSDPGCDLGEDHNPETHIIPLILRSALGTDSGLRINGDDYETPDGTCVRDFVHVSDLADAHVRALRHLTEGGTSVTLNLGVGRGYSIRELIDSAERLTGRKVPFQVGPRRNGDPASLVCDASLSATVLKWKPRYPSLDEMMKHALAWQKKIEATE